MLFPVVLFSQSNFEKGERYFLENNYEEAKKVFEKELKSTNYYYQVIEYLGDISCGLQDWDTGIKYFEILKDKFPNNANYHYKYGGALGMKAKSVNKFAALRMIDDVEASFLKATELDKKHIESRWALVIFYVEIPAIIGGSEKKSQRFANELMTISKVDGYLAKGYIDVYFERYNNALVNFMNAHKIGNSKTTFQKLYDLLLNKIGDKAKAEQLKKEFNKI